MPKRLTEQGSLPALRGRLIYDVVRGQIRVRMWPRPRGKPKSKAQQDQVDRFRLAQKLFGFLPASQQLSARQITAGTVLMPRDIFLGMASGTFVNIQEEGGPTLWPMTARTEMSEFLDIIGQQPGDMLVRNDDLWDRLPIGEQGDVLTITSSGIAWGAGGGGGGSGLVPTPALIPSLDQPTSGSNFALKGSVWIPKNDTQIRGVAHNMGAFRAPIEDVFIGVIDDLSTNGQITEVITQEQSWTQDTAGQQVAHIGWREFAQPITLQTGVLYLIASIVRGQGVDQANGQIFSNGDAMSPAFDTPDGAIKLMLEEPAPGDPITNVDPARYRVYPLI